MTKLAKVGLYGGTFDPIHFGHLSLAIDILEAHQLDEVWFCPAQISPHKIQRQPIAVEHRLKMVQLAIEDIPKFKLIDIETKKRGPSFTIDTLNALLSMAEKNKQFYLILGDDSVDSFFRWHKPEEIVERVPLLVGRRIPNFVFQEIGRDPKICNAIKRGLTPTHVIEISGTEIRARLKKGLYIKHLVPAKVVDYIYDNHLYF